MGGAVDRGDREGFGDGLALAQGLDIGGPVVERVNPLAVRREVERAIGAAAALCNKPGLIGIVVGYQQLAGSRCDTVFADRRPVAGNDGRPGRNLLIDLPFRLFVFHRLAERRCRPAQWGNRLHLLSAAGIHLLLSGGDAFHEEFFRGFRQAAVIPLPSSGAGNHPFAGCILVAARRSQVYVFGVGGREVDGVCSAAREGRRLIA